MQANLKNLETANNVTIRFLINYFTKSTIENGTDNGTYCNYLIKASGHNIIIKVLPKFKTNEQICCQLLSVLDSTLKSLPEGEIAFSLAESDLLNILTQIILETEFDSCKEISYEIIAKLTLYQNTHKTLINKNILKFLNQKLENFLKKSIQNLELKETKELAFIFQIVKNLGQNDEMIGEMISSQVLQKTFDVFKQNSEAAFLKDLFLEVLLPISENQNCTEIVKKTNIDLQQFYVDLIQGMNFQLIVKIEKVITNLQDEIESKSIIAQAKKKDCYDKTIIYLGVLSLHPIYQYLFEDKELMDGLMEKFQQSSTSELVKLSIMKYMMSIISLDPKYFNYFDQKKGIDISIGQVQDEKKDSYSYTIQTLKFFSTMLSISKTEFAKKLNEKKIPQTFLNYFCGLEQQYEDFRVQAVTNEKALDSIEYHKSETSKAILKTLKEIKPNEIVTKEIAMKFICFEPLSQELLEFLGKIYEIYPEVDLNLNEQFFKTIIALLKVFKNTEAIFDSVFLSLSKFNYSPIQGKIIEKLNIPTVLCDKIWLKPEWNRFALYCLRFIEKLVKEPQILTILKSGNSSVKLVASIKNFINEEDVKQLEGELTEGEQIKKKHSKKLTFAEEREIHNKSREVLEKLMDSTLLENFKKNITTSIKNFKPRTETVTILRAEYAVLTGANGINYYGIEGLRINLQNWLKDNIQQIDQMKDFQGKEILLADCIRSLSNYICITWSEHGKKLYEEKEISKIVFELLIKKLRESLSPVQSFVMLKVFKEWLIERIEIIENSTNLERNQIYDPNSFMMVSNNIKDQLITDVSDVLFSTHQKFEKNSLVLKLNFEVILLLGYVYPEWKAKIGKNFVPLILDALDKENLGEEQDFKSIELLNHICGIDGKSDEPKEEIITLAAKKGGVKIITKSISDNNYNEKYIAHCKTLLENMGKNEENLKDCYPEINQLIEKLKKFNNLNEPEKSNQLNDVIKAVDQLNAFCIVDTLRLYAFDNEHVQNMHKIWDYVAENRADKNGVKNPTELDNLEKGCVIAMANHLKSPDDDEEKKILFGNSTDDINSKGNLILNALRSLQKHKKNPQMVLLNEKILNQCFPSEMEDTVRNLAKKLNFQPDLDYLFNLHGKSDNQDLVNETTNLYMNLSENQKDEIMERKIKKMLRDLQQHLNDGNEVLVQNDWLNLIPYMNHQIIENKFGELQIEHYILETLNLLNNKTEQKTNQNIQVLIEEILGNPSIPDLGSNNRQKLNEEIKLAKNLTNMMLKLSPQIKEKIRNNQQIVAKSQIAGILNGSPQTFELYEDFLLNPKNNPILEENHILNCGTYLLMKNNQDSFKKEELGDKAELNISTLQSVAKSVQQPLEIKSSQICIQKVENNKDKVLNENIEQFGKMADKIVTQKKADQLIKEYVQAMLDYNSEDKKTLSKLLSTSRIISALLSSGIDKVNVQPFAKDLKKAFEKLFDSLKGEKVPNKKLLKFFENNMNYVARQMDGTDDSFVGQELWNKIIERYFILSPGLIKNNAKIIFDNLELCRPVKPNKNLFKDQFVENQADIFMVSEITENGELKSSNKSKTEEIALNYFRAINSQDIPEELALNNLECLSRSSLFCESFLATDKLKEFFKRMLETNSVPDPKFFNKNTEILTNVALTVEKGLQNNNQVPLNNFQQIPSEELLIPFIQNLEDQKPGFMEKSIEFLNLVYDLLKSKSIFFKRNIPITLNNILTDNWDQKEIFAVFLAKNQTDSSLQESVQQIHLYDKTRKDLEQLLFKENTIIKNPQTFSNFKSSTDLSENLKKQQIELKAFILGELSRVQENAKNIADLNNKNQTNVFGLYYQFEKFGNIPIIATKLIECTKNGIFQINKEDLDKNEAEVQKLIKAIPQQIQKYQEFSKTKQFLQDILNYLQDFISKKKPKTALERNIENLIQNQGKDIKERLKDLKELAQLYKELETELQKEPWNKDQKKIYDLVNDECKELLLLPNTQAPYSLNNLLVPKHLRLIANSKNSSFPQKLEALELLVLFSKTEEVLTNMLEDNFFVNKSSELINQIISVSPDIAQLPKEKMDVLKEDLEFMRALTNTPKGVEYIMQGPIEQIPLIQNIYNILQSKAEEDLKIRAIKLLKNLLKHSTNPNLEKKVLESLPQLLEQNKGSFAITSELVNLADVFASKGDDQIKALIKMDILKPVKDALSLYRGTGNLIETAASHLMYKMSNEKPDNHEYIMKSGAMQLLATPFSNPASSSDLHSNVCKLMLQLSFQNQSRKEKICDDNFIKGLVPLLIHYTKEENFKEKMVDVILKTMANFSLIQKGAGTLLQDGVIPAFNNFFQKYKESHDELNKLILCTTANISYEPNEVFITKIRDDKGIEFILDTLKYYSEKEKSEICEASIDSLTHVSAKEESLKYISQKTREATDILVDILRQKLNSKLVYKSLRCLTKIAEYQPISDRFLEKGGPAVTIGLFQAYPDDLKNIFQALKLISLLVKNYPDKFQEFVFAGCPEKIIDNFNLTWPIEIIKKIIDLFTRMAENENVKDILAAKFLDELVKIMNDYLKNKPLIKNGSHLLSICSNSNTSVQTIFDHNGNALADKILKNYISSEHITLSTLQLMENMLLMNEESKQQYLDMKTDAIVENLVETTHPVDQKEMNSQAEKVLELLRGQVIEHLNESEPPEKEIEIQVQQQNISQEKMEQKEGEKGEQKGEQNPDVNIQALEKNLPTGVLKYLTQGRILRVYGEDGVCRSMHFFLSKDLIFLKCKHPKENFVKQKWIIAIHQVRSILYKYNQDSPIAKSANFFRKAPPREKCFSIYGPTLMDGPQNFHFLCESQFEAKKWFEYLTVLMEEFKKAKKERLSTNMGQQGVNDPSKPKIA